MMIKLGIQTNVYSNEAHKNLGQILPKIAAAGYQWIEIGAHRVNLEDPEGFQTVVKNSGLQVCALHTFGKIFDRSATESTLQNMDKVAKFAASIGVKNVALSSAEKYGKTPEEIKTSVATLNEVGRAAKQHGITLRYHNHNYEMVDDMSEYKAMMTGTDPALVSFIMDLCWVKRGGFDPAATLKKFAPRVSYVHFKDVTADGKWADLGQGVMDFMSIMETIRSYSDIFVVFERDEAVNDPEASMKVSRDFLRTLGI
jgi:inosose dehydratase